MRRGLIAWVLFGCALSTLAAPLPEFFSSDPEHDRLLNDMWRRHLRRAADPLSLRLPDQTRVPGIIQRIEGADRAIDALAWFDSSDANFPGEDRWHTLGDLLIGIPVDSFGYVFTATNDSTNATWPPHRAHGAGWRFPQYPVAFGDRAGGWEWNGVDTEGWRAEGADVSAVTEGAWCVEGVDAARLRLYSPPFSYEASHVPLIQLDLRYAATPATSERPAAFRLYWTTERAPEFDRRRSVASDAWPLVPIASLEAGFARRIWLPMHLHPEWRGATITRLRLDPCVTAGETTAPMHGPLRLRLHHLRLNYDTRQAANNPAFVCASARRFLWDGNEDWLRAQLPRMRSAVSFIVDHLRLVEAGVPDQSWFIGHDGLGWPDVATPRVGHGIAGNRWAVLPMGPRDLPTALGTLEALRAMAEIEAWVEVNPEADSARPNPRAPDGFGRRRARESAASLAAKIEPLRAAIREQFWNRETGRFGAWRDVEGRLHDFGYVHLNLRALSAGVGTPADARRVLLWLDGERRVPEDAAGAAAIHDWGFAPRFSTRRNALDYNWGWSGHALTFGDDLVDGGAALETVYHDVAARLRHDDLAGAWRAWQRMLTHHAKVLAAGGEGADLYSAYYAMFPAAGRLQREDAAAPLALDGEHLDSLLAPSAWVRQWLGVDAPEPGVLEIAPTLPPGLAFIGARRLTYREHELNLRVDADAIDLRGSRMDPSSPARLRLRFREPTARAGRGGALVLLRDDRPTTAPVRRTRRGAVVDTDLAAARFQIR